MLRYISKQNHVVSLFLSQTNVKKRLRNMADLNRNPGWKKWILFVLFYFHTNRFVIGLSYISEVDIGKKTKCLKICQNSQVKAYSH